MINQRKKEIEDEIIRLNNMIVGLEKHTCNYHVEQLVERIRLDIEKLLNEYDELNNPPAAN